MYLYIVQQLDGQLMEQQDIQTFKLNNNKEMMYLIESKAPLAESLLKSEDKAYEAIDSSAELKSPSYMVFNSIPVTEEGRAMFEERFQNRARKIEDERGFVAIRVCRPLNSDTYIVMSLWESEADFQNWKNSNAYQHAHKKRGTAEGIDQQQPQIFPRPSYVATYMMK